MSRISRLACLLACLVACAHGRASPLQAQRVASVGVGVTSVRFADIGDLSALAISPAFAASSGRGVLAAGGTWSRFNAGDWTAQALVNGALYTNVSSAGLVGELGATAGGSRHSDGAGAGTGQWLATARGYLLRPRYTAWLGGSSGSMWDGINWRPARQGELGVLLNRRSMSLTALVTAVDASGIGYADGRLLAKLDHGPFEFSGSVGARAGGRLPAPAVDSRAWGDVGVTAWMAPSLALVASAGTYPADLMQGFPSARFASLGLRVGGRSRARTERAGERVDDRAREEWQASRRAGVEEFSLAHAALPDGRRRLRVRAPAARSVELSGDPTAWTTVPMRAAGNGWWELDLPLGPGVHEIVVRLDGGTWLVPPGLALAQDEFGGRAGRLIISG